MKTQKIHLNINLPPPSSPQPQKTNITQTNKNPSAYRNVGRPIASNTKNLKITDKINIHDLFCNNNRYQKQSKNKTLNKSLNIHTRSHSLRQTNNIFYIRFNKTQQQHTDIVDQYALPKIIMQRKQMIKAAHMPIIVDEQQERNKDEGYMRGSKKLENSMIVTASNNNTLDVYNRSGGNYGKRIQPTRYLFSNNKQDGLINPELGSLMFNKNYDRNEKSKRILGYDFMETQLMGTQKTMYPPKKSYRQSKIKKNKRQHKIDKNEGMLNKNQHIVSKEYTMTGLPKSQLASESKKKPKKEQIYSPWSTSLDIYNNQ